MLYTDLHNQFTVEVIDGFVAGDVAETSRVFTYSFHSGDCVVDDGSVDGLEGDEVGVLDGLVDHEVAFVHFEDVFEKEKISLLMPFAFSFLLHVHDEGVIRSDGQFHLTFVDSGIP